MPAPIVLRNLSPAPKKVLNPPDGHPVIATREDLRDGNRSTAPTTSSPQWLSHSQTSRAPAPLLRFTDLISGPATGLGDGLGSGVIVTVWAQGVGDSQGAGQVYFTDALGTKRPAAHVYYWKRADGQLPSGPARLWYSHLMQEIAFSIPAGSVNGAGQITVETGGQTSNALPFTVRAGNIYHVKSTGSASNAGSFSAPWSSPDHATSSFSGGPLAPAGSTIYVHDVVVGEAGAPPVRGIYWNNHSAGGDYTNQFGIVAYPGFHPTVTAQRGFENYEVPGQVVSKYTVVSSNYLATDDNGQPLSIFGDGNETYGIQTSKYGRTVANRIQDIPGGASSKWNAAINGGGKFVHGNKIFGNEVFDHGDNGTDKLHHTTYLSNRSGQVVEAWEWGWNFLHENKAKAGIHQYDEKVAGSDLSGILKIHDNVIVDQGGGGISIGCNGALQWSMDCEIRNNLIVNAGNPADWDGIDPTTANGPEDGSINIADGGNGVDTGLTGTYTIEHNLIYKFDTRTQSQTYGGLGFSQPSKGPALRWNKNVTVSDQDVPMVGKTNAVDMSQVDLTGSGNAWHYEGGNPVNAIAPGWDGGAITTDPGITLDGAIISVSSGSAITGQSAQTGHDLYGVPRTSTGAYGPVEAQ